MKDAVHKNLKMAEEMIKRRAASEFALELCRTELAHANDTFVPTVRICGLLGDATIPVTEGSPDDIALMRKAVLATTVAVRGYCIIVTTKAVIATGEDSIDNREQLLKALKERNAKKIPGATEGIVQYGCAYWGIKAELVRSNGPRVDVTDHVSENEDIYSWLNGFWDAVNDENRKADPDLAKLVDDIVDGDINDSPKSKNETMH